jgi:pimeloyl-ACP methyl ester carboxylesterase
MRLLGSTHALDDWYLIHGFNRSAGLFDGLASDMREAGMLPHIVDYGHQLTLSTKSAVKAIIKECPDGCNVIAHSNGAIAAWIAAAESGLWIRKLIMVQPPIARDAIVPPTIGSCWIVWNKGDKVVSWSRRYNAIIDALLPWNRQSHQLYGDAGRYGPAEGSRAHSVQVSPLMGHSGIFTRQDWRDVVVELTR